MNPDPPADRPETSIPLAEAPVAREYAYPSELAALVLTRWHDATAAGHILVVSQDGGLRFIRWHDDGVTYWDQVATGLWDA